MPVVLGASVLCPGGEPARSPEGAPDALRPVEPVACTYDGLNALSNQIGNRPPALRGEVALNHRIRRLARTGELMSKVLRVLLWLVFKREQDLAVDRAARIKEHYLTPLAGRKAVNTFQWAKARLTLEEPEALAVVQRFEADSKFFRS